METNLVLAIGTAVVLLVVASPIIVNTALTSKSIQVKDSIIDTLDKRLRINEDTYQRRDEDYQRRIAYLESRINDLTNSNVVVQESYFSIQQLFPSHDPQVSLAPAPTCAPLPVPLLAFDATFYWTIVLPETTAE